MNALGLVSGTENSLENTEWGHRGRESISHPVR